MFRGLQHISIIQEMWRDRDCISSSTGHMLTERHSVSSESRTPTASWVMCADCSSPNALETRVACYAEVKPMNLCGILQAGEGAHALQRIPYWALEKDTARQVAK